MPDEEEGEESEAASSSSSSASSSSASGARSSGAVQAPAVARSSQESEPAAGTATGRGEGVEEEEAATDQPLETTSPEASERQPLLPGSPPDAEVTPIPTKPLTAVEKARAKAKARMQAAKDAKQAAKEKAKLMKEKAKQNAQAASDWLKGVDWGRLCGVAGGGSCVLLTGFIVFNSWCVMTPWTSWSACFPAVDGAPWCGPGLSETTREIVRGFCGSAETRRQRNCSMGECIMPDYLAPTTGIPCNTREREHLLVEAEPAYGKETWAKIRACSNAYLCCYKCNFLYGLAAPLRCGDKDIAPQPIFTVEGCLTCHLEHQVPPINDHGSGLLWETARTISDSMMDEHMFLCHGNDTCVRRWRTHSGEHQMCCVRAGPIVQERYSITSHKHKESIFEIPKGLDLTDNYRLFPHKSAFLGVVHRPFAYPSLASEVHCQMNCWEESQCYLYTYVSMKTYLTNWRGRCVLMDEPTANTFGRASPSTWVPEADMNSGLKVAAAMADVIVSMIISDEHGSGTNGPLMLYVCKRLGDCLESSPMRISSISCRAGAECLRPGREQHFVAGVAAPKKFTMNAVKLVSLTQDALKLKQLAVDLNGHVGRFEDIVIEKGKPFEGGTGCTTTGGDGTSRPGMPCLTECYSGVSRYGWCYTDQDETVWGPCNEKCAVEEEEATGDSDTVKSGMSCAELNWPTWSHYNQDRSVCAASNARPLRECSGALSWEAAKDFCEAVGARLCTEKEILADETAGTGCGLDHRAIWTSTPCSHGYVTAAGATQFRVEVPTTCAQPASKAGYARCCGDSRTLVIRFSRIHRDSHTLPGRVHTRTKGGLAGWQVIRGINSYGKHGFFLQSGMQGPGAPDDNEKLEVMLHHVRIAERGGEIEFHFKIDSEAKADVLRFFIDGKEVKTGGFPVSGKIDWTIARFAFPAEDKKPLHDFLWIYQKDISGSVGRDVACIDRITVFGVVGEE